MPTDRDKHFRTDHLKKDLSRRTVVGAFFTAVSQVSRSVLQFGSTIVLARLLTPDDFGLVGMVMAAIGFVAIFKDLGLSQATIQREEITHEHISALFWINLGLSTGVMIVSAALAPVLIWFYGENELLGITLALAGTALLGGLTIQHQALLRRQMRFGTLATLEVASLALKVGAAISLAALGYGYWALVVGQVTGALVTAIGVWIACDWRPSRPAKTGEEVRAMVRFGGNVTGFNIVNYFARNLDDMLIGRFAGKGALGLYQKAYELMMLPLTQVNQPISRVALPALSRLVSEPERYRSAYLRILEKVLLITVPLGVFLILTADWLVLAVLGDQWVEASSLLAVMGLMFFTQPLANSTGWLFLSQDRTSEMFRWGLVGSSLSVLSFLVGLPWGVFGVAASYSISGLIVRTPLLLWWVGRKGPVKTGDFYRAAAPLAVAGVVATGAVYAFRLAFGDGPIAIGLAVAFLATVVSSVVALLTFPKGRAALFDLKTLVMELRDKGRVPQEESSEPEAEP